MQQLTASFKADEMSYPAERYLIQLNPSLLAIKQAVINRSGLLPLARSYLARFELTTCVRFLQI